MGKFIRGMERLFPICAVLLVLPAIAASQPLSYFDDFSSYMPGQPPPGYLLRGASGAAPTVQDIGGSGPAYRRLSFPYVGGQSWDSWALKDGLTLQAPYVVTVKIRFQTSGDRGGLTIAWNDTNWNRVDIQPNIFWQNVEFRISYTGPIASSPVVTGPGLMSGGLPMQLGTDYWLQVEATSNGPGQGQVIVSWSTDGTTFTPVVTATGLAEVDGLTGMGTAGPNLPNVYFDDFSVSEEETLGSITAHTFHDANQNGVQDSEEVNLAGWEMTLHQGGGCTGAILDSGITDANGNFTVDELQPGTYSVQETIQNKWVNIAPLCQSVMVSAGQAQTMLFGNWPKGGKPPEIGGSHLGILLPFSIGQGWTICQGYNGQVSHTGTVKYALDLSIDPASAGPTGCGLGPSASDNQIVTAPGHGKVISFWSYDATNDLVCIDLDAGGSVQIGHIVPQKADGVPLKEKDRVVAGEQIGTVLPLSQSSQSGYAHIHIEAFSKSMCKGSSAVPFIGAFQFQCVPPLPFEGDTDQNQYSGESYTRCY